MNKPEYHKMFNDNYVIVYLDVLERGAKLETDENPGGKDLMKEWGGENSGLPFYVFLDAKGKKLADSNAMPKAANIGYPGSAEEIAEFGKLIEKTAPKWKESDRKNLIDYLIENEPKAAGH